MLKMLGVILMLIDHIGMVFFPYQIQWRLVGRLAMPIFAYSVAKGFVKTSDIKQYKHRMFIFACISQLPFMLVMYSTGLRETSLFSLNIGFTFFVALQILDYYQKVKDGQEFTNRDKGYLLIWIVIANILPIDYGFYGIVVVWIYYQFYIIHKQMVLTTVLLLVSLVCTGSMSQMMIQLYSVGAIVLIHFLKDLYAGKWRKFFYLFYPVHLFVLACIKILS